MKHLIKYKLFESTDFSIENDNLKLSIKYILADIEDDGFEVLTFITNYTADVNIYKPVISYDKVINSTGMDKHIDFKYSEIKNAILHLTSFLHENKFKIKKCSIYPHSKSFSSREGDVNMSGDESLRLLKLSYDKSFSFNR